MKQHLVDPIAMKSLFLDPSFFTLQ